MRRQWWQDQAVATGGTRMQIESGNTRETVPVVWEGPGPGGRGSRAEGATAPGLAPALAQPQGPAFSWPRLSRDSCSG